MENVMLNSIQTQIKIVDFGLSNIWSSENPLRTHCGSPEYAAPELFITGRQYGVEVDLWSLGIILYGMVLGQLPFITNRTEQVSSQERRKRLVAQINKGLSTAHRRALALFSPEFRHLMNKLLIANSSERLTTKELIAHPWITEKGKKMIKINPLRVLDDRWKTKIISEIETLIQLDRNFVITTIIQDPLGKIGGLYNILVHKQQMSQLTGDGVTKNLPALTLMEISELARNNGKPPMKVASARPIAQRKPYTATACCRKPQSATPRDEVCRKDTKVLTTPSPKKNIRPKRKESAPARAPATAQPISKRDPRMVDYRLITSPTLRRKAYSATITPKNNRPRSPAEGASRPTSPKLNRFPPTEKDLESGGKRTYDIFVPEKMDIKEINSIRKTSSAKSKIRLIMEPKPREIKNRILTSVVEKSRSKSDQLRVKNSTTISNKKTTKPEKINVSVSHSASRAAEKIGSANSKSKAHELQKEIFNRQEPWERSVYAFGDSPVRALTAPSKQSRKPAIYDPIAKSIADYVANNVPDKMNKFSWYRK